MTIGTSNITGYRQRNQRYRAMSEINVTPFVDVMLVLLIVFMITAPLLTVGVAVDLPKTNAATLPGQDEPLTVSIDSSGLVYLQESPIGVEELVLRLRAISQNKADQRIFVRGDKAVDYGRVMQVMATINSAGFKRVALVTEKPKPAVSRR